MLRGVLALIWIGCAGFLAFQNWDPLKLHYLTLFFRETPFFFLDIAAGFYKLFSEGLKELGYVTVLLLAAAGSGRLALAPFKHPVAWQSRLVIALALGFAVLSYGTFALGLLGLYNSTGIIISAAALGLFACTAIWRLPAFKGIQKKGHFSWTAFGLFCLISVAAVFLFAKALWPAVHIDAITYHLGIPNYYIQEGGLSYIPYDMYTGFPFFTEMLYTLAMLVAGQKAAQCTSVLIFLVSIITVYEFVRTLIGYRYAQMAALLYTATPCFMDASLVCGADISLVYYVLMATYCFLLWKMHCRSNGLLVLTGVFVGVCLSIKYTALALVPILLVAALAWDAVHTDGRVGVQFFKRMIICTAAALAVFLPWCIKNVLATGNPLYPALYPVLGGADMSPEMYAVINRFAYAVSIKNVLAVAAANLQAVFLFTPRFFSLCGPMGNAGLALLFFVPLLPAVSRISPVIKALCSSAVIMFVLWTPASGVLRFYYPGIALLLIIASYVVVSMTSQLPGLFKPFVGGAAALCIILNGGMGVYQANMRTMTYGIDFLHDSDDAYLRRHMIENPEALLDSYSANCYINDNLGPDACVLIIGDVQHLYIKRRHRYTYLSATTPYGPFKNFSGAYNAIHHALKKEGITHILYNPFELMRLQDMGAIAWKKDDTPLIEDFLKSPFVRRIYFSKRQAVEGSLYELL
jgi:hypothetical protein